MTELHRHLKRIEDKLDLVLQASRRSNQENVDMATLLDNLKASVERNNNLERSAIQLIQGLAAQVRAAGTDPMALRQLAEALDSQSDSLAAAISANTPAITPPADTGAGTG